MAFGRVIQRGGRRIRLAVLKRSGPNLDRGDGHPTNAYASADMVRADFTVNNMPR